VAPHYCVVARIAEYFDPGNPTTREITVDNNEAQSNHTQLISSSASPSTRETGVVKVVNPLTTDADCRVQVRQTSPYARTYLDHAWVRLGPGEERDVRFRTESIIGDPVVGRLLGDQTSMVYRQPNSLRLTGIAHETQTCDGFVTGGAHVLVRAARATRFTRFGLDGNVAFGRIEAVDDRSGVDGIVLVVLHPPGRPEDQSVHEGQVLAGSFRAVLRVEVPPGWQATAHYTGGFDLAPCDSERILT
jgi:hypothetical protein